MGKAAERRPDGRTITCATDFRSSSWEGTHDPCPDTAEGRELLPLAPAMPTSLPQRTPGAYSPAMTTGRYAECVQVVVIAPALQDGSPQYSCDEHTLRRLLAALTRQDTDVPDQ